jgi:hypothetical protein
MDDPSTKYPERLVELVDTNNIKEYLDDYDKLSNLKKDIVRRKIRKLKRRNQHAGKGNQNN